MRNRSLRIQLVKDPKETPENYFEDPTPNKKTVEVIALTRLFLKEITILAGAGYAAKKVLDTGSEIALIYANHKFK